MNVAIVDGDISYPATSGKRLRTLNLMLRLARRHKLTYICRGQAGGPGATRATEFLAGHGIRTVVVDHPVARKSGPLFYGRLVGNLLSPLPYSVASHLSPLVRRTVNELADRNRFDLWHFEWPAYAEALHPSRRVPVVVSAPNVDTLIWQRYHENEKHPFKRWYIKQQWRKFEAFERRVFQRATRVVAVTRDDATILRDQFGVERVEVVDNGVDRAYYESVNGRRIPDRLLYLGALDWRPNLDALQVLLDRIFPAVLKEHPAATLCVVGRSPPVWLIQRVRATPGVELHADVPDVRPFLGDCGLLAVPLRIGGGSRLKILEALASGLPVVATRVGAEGLCLTPDQDLLVVEDVEDMAAALVDAIRNPVKMRALAAHGREVVRDRYDWNGLADKLERVWEDAVGVTARLKSEGACTSST
jgi:glycosyltransferase involved in cell wall biosynthesis